MENNKQQAIRILQSAAAKAARTGNKEAVNTLHNAVFYLLTGRAREYRQTETAIGRELREGR